MRAAQRASSAYGNRPQPICRSQSQPFRRSQSQLPAASTRLFVPTRRWIPLALHRVAPYEYPRSRQVSLYTQETCVRGPRSTCVRCFWSKCRVKPCRPGARNPVSNFSGRSCAHKFSLEQKFRVGNRKRQGISEAIDIACLAYSVPITPFKSRHCRVCHAHARSTDDGLGQARCERDLEFLDLTLNDGDTFAYVPVAPCAKSNQQKIDPSHRCAIVGVTNRRCEARSTEPPLRRSTRPSLKRTGNAASTIGVPSSTSPKERLDPRSVCRTRERRRSPSTPVSPQNTFSRATARSPFHTRH